MPMVWVRIIFFLALRYLVISSQFQVFYYVYLFFRKEQLSAMMFFNGRVINRVIIGNCNDFHHLL
jgi:hypothetical protein